MIHVTQVRCEWHVRCGVGWRRGVQGWGGSTNLHNDVGKVVNVGEVRLVVAHNGNGDDGDEDS